MPTDAATSPPPVEKRLSRVSLALWVFIFALAARLLVLGQLAASPWLFPESGDMRFYSDWAMRISGGETSDLFVCCNAVGQHQAFYGLPGYAFFLAAVYWITDLCMFVTGMAQAPHPHPLVVGILQSASDAGVAFLIFKIAEQVFRDEKPSGGIPRARIIGLIAALGWVFFKPAQTFAAVLMPTTWLVLVFWGCVLWILKTRGSSFWKPWLWMGLAIGGMAMIIATVLFLVPLILVAIVLRVAPEKPLGQRLPRLAAAACCVVAGIFAGASPCWIHNYCVAREPVFLSAHSGINFYIGNNEIANGYPKIPPGMRAGQEGMLKDSITMAEVTAGHSLTRAGVSKFWSEKAGEFTHNHRAAWWRLMAMKFRNFWNAFQYDDLSLISLFTQDGITTPGVGFGFVAALAIPGLIAAFLRFPRSRWVAAAILLHMSALMPVFVTERYRLAAVPGLLIFAGYGLVEMWAQLSAVRWRQPAFQCAGAALMACFVAVAPKDDGLWSLDYYNTGIKFEEAGTLDLEAHNIERARHIFERAQKNLEIAYAYVPLNSEINFALGNLWLKKADLDPATAGSSRTQAKNYYRNSIQINARHAGAFNNLGVLAMSEKNWTLAGKFFAESVKIEPDDAKTHFLLARVLLEGNDREGAKKEIERALELKPNQPQFKALLEQITNPSHATGNPQ